MSTKRSYVRPRVELVDALKVHLDFLERSGAAYDAGFEAEAFRLAVSVQVLVSDGGNSRSLLGQLGLKDQLRSVDSSLPHRGLRPGHPGENAGLASMEVQWARGGRYVPLLDRANQGQRRPGVPFGVWWSNRIYRQLTRADLVASLANQDGGAHVDPKLTDAYAELSRHNGLGWSYSDTLGTSAPFEGNAGTASMRQMAWELQTTLREQVTAQAAYIGPKHGPNRNDPCPCGSGLKFKRCCGAERLTPQVAMDLWQPGATAQPDAERRLRTLTAPGSLVS